MERARGDAGSSHTVSTVFSKDFGWLLQWHGVERSLLVGSCWLQASGIATSGNSALLLMGFLAQSLKRWGLWEACWPMR